MKRAAGMHRKGGKGSVGWGGERPHRRRRAAQTRRRPSGAAARPASEGLAPSERGVRLDGFKIPKGLKLK